MSLALVLMWLTILPAVASASIVVTNRMSADVTATSAGPRFYAYRQGSEAVFDVLADFDQGTYLDSKTDVTETLLVLTGTGALSWWDSDWEARRCFDVKNPSASTLLEQQVRLVFDTTSDVAAGLVTGAGDDYRAIAADDMTQLDLWVEEGVGTVATTIWVQLDLAPSAVTRFCLYFDNPAATSVSDQGAVFSYSTPRQLYYPAYWRFDGGAGNNGTLDLVSFVNGNTITVDGVALIRNAGGVATFTGVTPNSIITVTGPIAGRGRGGGFDSIVPVSYGGTTMVFPTNRSSQRWTLVSPTGAVANVEIYNGTTLQWSGNVGAAALVVDAEVTNGNSGIIRSTNGVPVIVTHTATANSNADAQLVPPFFPGEDIYGVRSRGTWVGFDAAGSVDIYRSDSTSQTIAGAAGSLTQIYDAADLDGNGTAERLTNMTGATAAIQQADRDGWESTAYLPERLLETEYFLPTDAEYVAFACPVTTNITVGSAVVPCVAPIPGYPGHGWHPAAPQGTRIASTNGMKFFAYYEDDQNDDETNLFGMKSALSPTPQPLAVGGGAFEPIPMTTSGTWTSPVIDTTVTSTNVFGLIEMSATAPAGTAISAQVARGATPALALAAPFVGPDGTAATSYPTGQTPTPFDWDFTDPYLRVRITLTTTVPGVTPSVDLLRIGYDLPEVSQISTHTVNADELDYVLRVWTEDPVLTLATAHLFHDTTTLGAGSKARVGIDPTSHVVVVGGTVTQQSGPPTLIGPGQPHNIIVESAGSVGAKWEVIWMATLPSTTIHIIHRVHMTFA